MYYFTSDVHLGAGDETFSRRTEQRFVEWLDKVAEDAAAIFLVGDIFDFWFEYGKVAPKGFVRTLGKLASLTDRGIEVYFFAGNHDMWCSDYLERECGVKIIYKPQRMTLAGKELLIAHGDNMNISGKPLLQLMNWGFRSKVLRKIFSWCVHPDLALRFGQWWSGKSRKSHKGAQTAEMLTPLIEYATEYGKEHDVDYFVFGHLHYPADIDSSERILFMGDWYTQPSYIALDNNGKIELKTIANG